MSTCHVSRTARPWRCRRSLDADPSTAASRWLCARRACVAIWPSRWPSVRRRVSRTRRARCRPCSWSRSGGGRFEYRGTGGDTSAGAKLPRWLPPPPLPRPLPLPPLRLPLLKRARWTPVAWARRRARRRRRHPPSESLSWWALGQISLIRAAEQGGCHFASEPRGHGHCRGCGGGWRAGCCHAALHDDVDSPWPVHTSDFGVRAYDDEAAQPLPAPIAVIRVGRHVGRAPEGGRARRGPSGPAAAATHL